MEVHLIKLLAEHNGPKQMLQNGWGKEAWSSIHSVINNRFPFASLTKQQVKDHEQYMKKTYRNLKSLSELSGFGWDYDNNIVTAPDEVWESILPRNPIARKWHKKSYPHYKALEKLYEGRFAEGKSSRGPGDYGGSSGASQFQSDPISPPSPAYNSPEVTTRVFEVLHFDDGESQFVEPIITQTYPLIPPVAPVSTTP